MKKNLRLVVCIMGLSCLVGTAQAQYKSESVAETATEKPLVLSLEQALKIALSENVSVKVADMEIERLGYAKKGTYASLFPQIDFSGSYQRTIKKQVMYMDFDMGSMGGFGGGASAPGGSSGTGEESSSASSSSSAKDGLEIGRWNSMSAGVSAQMPLVNAQLWKSIQISGMDVELAVEKARASRLDMVGQVKNAFYSVLLAKEAFHVYKEVYENAVKNYDNIKNKAIAQKVSSLELARAKTNVANAIPNVYNAESSILLAMWQLKALMGVDLDMNIDVEGSLFDYSEHMLYDIHQHDSISLENNSTMKQLAIQAEELAQSIKLQKYAYIPTLALAFNFSFNSMANDVSFSQWNWTPYSYVGVSLQIPIFAGGKRLNQVRQTKAGYEQMKLQMTDTERNLKIAIRQNLNTMETNMKSFYAAGSAKESANKAYTIAEASYEVGRATLIELNDAQLALTQASLAEAQAIYNFIVAKAQLEQTLGQDFIAQ